MGTWKIAGVQMDCRRGEKAANLEVIQTRLRQAAENGARLVIFPECALTGYCYESKDEAWPNAEPLPGPAPDAITVLCRQLNVWRSSAFWSEMRATAACTTLARSLALGASWRSTARSIFRFWESIDSPRRAIGHSPFTISAACASASISVTTGVSRNRPACSCCSAPTWWYCLPTGRRVLKSPLRTSCKPVLWRTISTMRP